MERPATHQAYELHMPTFRNGPAIFASPHSGRNYTPEFLCQTELDRKAIRSSEDAYVDVLFRSAPEFGAPLLCATVPRLYVDLNRSPDEIDTRLFNGLLPASASRRAAAGLGVLPRLAGNGSKIYPGKIPATEVKRRLSACFTPYHACLRTLLSECRNSFGMAVLFDCHSMPHSAMDRMGNGRSKLPDIVLGDRHGRSCSAEIVEQVKSIFTDAGFRVARNLLF